MRDNRLLHRVLKKFDKIPLIDNGDIFTPDKEAIDNYFEILQENNYRNWENIKKTLLELEFTREEVERKITDNIPIDRYEQWRKEFDLYALNQCYSSEMDESARDDSANKTPRIVLNKRNPFADVAIEDQAFLYPTKKGFDVLAFTTNRHFIRRETEDGDFYAVIPGFKVARQRSRERINAIVASDSVSTPLPEQKDNKRIVYI